MGEGGENTGRRSPLETEHTDSLLLPSGAATSSSPPPLPSDRPASACLHPLSATRWRQLLRWHQPTRGSGGNTQGEGGGNGNNAIPSSTKASLDLVPSLAVPKRRKGKEGDTLLHRRNVRSFLLPPSLPQSNLGTRITEGRGSLLAALRWVWS